MIQFVIQKMLNKKWMVLAVLIGNVLLFSIAAATPVYTETVLQRSLENAFGKYIEENNRYPMAYQVRTTAYPKDKSYIAEKTAVLQELQETFDLPLRESVIYETLSDDGSSSDLERDDRKVSVKVSCMTDFTDHIKMIQGELYGTTMDSEGIIEGVVSEKALQEQHILLGEVVTLSSFTYEDGSPIRVRITGAFRAGENDDIYWVNSPSSYITNIFIDKELFDSLFVNSGFEKSVAANWAMLFDYSEMRVKRIPFILQETEKYNEYFKEGGWFNAFNSYSTMLTSFQETEKKVRTTIMVLEIPILVILAAFIFMVSRQMLDMEQTEMAVLKSRGVSKRQLILVYFIQSLIFAVLSLIIALPLSWLIVRVLSSANAFLQFVRRRNLKVIYTNEMLVYLGAAVALSIAAMVIPVFKRSGTTIVNHRQRKNRKKSDKPLWQKFFLDFILLAVSGYGLFSFYNQRELLSERVLSGAALDPLLYISASVFMLGFGLLLLRLLPLLEKLVYRMFREKWSPALYTSYLRVIRTRKQQDFIMIFLFMTLAIGVFDATAAYTVNSNSDQNLKYLCGADIVLKEPWQSNADSVAAGEADELIYYEPNFTKYYDLLDTGAASLTKVLNDSDGVVSVPGGKVSNVQLLGIHTKEFGETVDFDTALLPEHWYNYLNVLAKSESGVLLSSNFQTEYGLSLGDTVYFRNKADQSTRGVILGFVEYFPSFAKSTYRKGSDGKFTNQENYLVVANLSWLQQNFGVTPYEIWIKNKESSSAYIYDFRDENELTFMKFRDLSAEYQKSRSGSILQGTNGILTVGFIVALVLCTVGFLIYWILSIRDRELQFGIFRAMGMSMKEIIVMLLNEHLYISLFAILIGVVDGILTSKLFMPLIQIGYSSADTAVPLKVASAPSDMIRLAVIVALMLISCLFILSVIVRRMKIAQALKLGED